MLIKNYKKKSYKFASPEKKIVVRFSLKTVQVNLSHDM